MASLKRFGLGLGTLAGASLLLASPALADTQPTISQETTLRPDLISAQIVPGSDNLVDYCYDKSVQVLPGVTASRFQLRPYALGTAFGIPGLSNATWGTQGVNTLAGGTQLANSIVGTTNGPGGTSSCVRVSFANNANLAAAHYTQAETQPNVVGKFDNTTSQYANLGDSAALGGSDQVVPEPNPGTTPGPTGPTAGPNQSNFTLAFKNTSGAAVAAGTNGNPVSFPNAAANSLTYVITFDKALDVNYTLNPGQWVLYNDNGTRTLGNAITFNNGGGNTSQSVAVNFAVGAGAINDTYPRVASTNNGLVGAVRGQLSGILDTDDSNGYAVSQSPNLIRAQQVDPNNGNLWDFYFSKSVDLLSPGPASNATPVRSGIAVNHNFYLVGEGGTRVIFDSATTITQNNDTRVRVHFPKQPHFAPEEVVRAAIDDSVVKTEGQPDSAQFDNPIEVAPAILANASSPTTIGRYPVGSSLAGFSAAPDLVDASFDINTGRATFTFDQRVNYFTPPDPSQYKIDYHYAGTNMGEAELTGVQYLGQGPGNNEKQVVVQMQALSPTPAPTIDGGHILSQNPGGIFGAAAPANVAAQAFLPDPLVTTSVSVFQGFGLNRDPAQTNAFAAAGLPLAAAVTNPTPNPNPNPGPATPAPGPAATTGAPAPGPAAVAPVTTTTVKAPATKKKATKKKAKKHKKKKHKKKKSKRVALLGKKH